MADRSGGLFPHRRPDRGHAVAYVGAGARGVRLLIGQEGDGQIDVPAVRDTGVVDESGQAAGLVRHEQVIVQSQWVPRTSAAPMIRIFPWPRARRSLDYSVIPYSGTR
jgi:hypothetical protein